MQRLEKLTRMLTTNLGTATVFDDAMVAEALRVATQPNIDGRMRIAFLESLASAFDGGGRPVATIRAGRKGRRSATLGPLGVSERAMVIYNHVTDSSARSVKQDAAIAEMMERYGVTESTVWQDLADAREAVARLRSTRSPERRKDPSSDKKATFSGTRIL